MNNKTDFSFTSSVVLVPFLLVLLLWTVYYLELAFGINLNSYGIYPRSLLGLRGIVFSPFLHASISHLGNNTLPIAVLSMALFYFYRPLAWKVLLYGTIITGLSTWLIGRPSYHIGISGVIYLLASFIFFKGIRTKHYRLTALSLFVVFMYGGMLWYVFPLKDGISWEGHLSGFVVGVFLAFLLPNHVTKPKQYAWEQEDYNEEEDEFLKHFDKDGNFIEHKEEEEEVSSALKITYHFKSTASKNDKAD